MREWLNVPIIDNHVHVDSHRVIDDMLELSSAAGFGRLNILCVPGSPERGLAYNAIAMLAKARHPGKVYVFGGLQYNAGQPVTPAGLRGQAEALWATGCDGMKMLEGKPSTRRRIPWRMDDPLYDEYYAFLQERGIPILWHVADPASFWDPALVSPNARKQGWDYSDGTFPPRAQFYEEVDRVLAKFPSLRAIFAHFYFCSTDPERAAAFLDRWPTVSFDLTPGAEMYRNFSKNPALWREFFIRYQDRLIFGTDNFAPREPWAQGRASMLDKVRMMRQFLETAETFEGFGTATSKWVTGVGLPPEVLAKIYSRNFERYVGATPRPLDTEAAQQQCRAMLAFVEGKAELAATCEELAAVARGLTQVVAMDGPRPPVAATEEAVAGTAGCETAERRVPGEPTPPCRAPLRRRGTGGTCGPQNGPLLGGVRKAGGGLETGCPYPGRGKKPQPLTADETQEARTPAWARVVTPESYRPFLGKYGLPEPFCSKKGPLGSKVAGVDRWQANHFVVYRPETAAALYGIPSAGEGRVAAADKRGLGGGSAGTKSHALAGAATAEGVSYRPGVLPSFERVATLYAADLATAEEKATALVTRALPELCRHPTIPPIGPHCGTDRGLLDEPLLASGCGFCNEQARVFVRLCQVSGIAARLVYLFYADKATGHTTAEFWTGDKWAMVDVSWYTVFPGPDGRLMSAAECHGDASQRLCMAIAYQSRMRQIVAMTDEALCGLAFPPGTPVREATVRAKAAELRDYVRARMPLEYLTGHLWQFGILDYPLPE